MILGDGDKSTHTQRDAARRSGRRPYLERTPLEISGARIAHSGVRRSEAGRNLGGGGVILDERGKDTAPERAGDREEGRGVPGQARPGEQLRPWQVVGFGTRGKQ